MTLRPGSLRPDGRAATLGVLGGGQLGRMFVQAAQAMGYRTVVLDPDAHSPAGAVAHRHIQAAYTDAAALDTLAADCDAVTTEFENVPAQALRRLAESVAVAPSADAVATCQDRVLEKARFQACGVPCVPHASLAVPADLAAVGPELFPAILKTATLGYDGKGQVRVARAEDLPAAWATLGGVRCLLEQRVALAAEFSVVLARDAAGACVHLPVQHNLHRDGILAVTQSPAPGLDPPTAHRAVAHAQAIAQAMDYVGVLCVEFFLLEDGALLANEMAPRPHNSGHHSLDSCDVSQFELQVRTLAGLPLPTPRQHSPAVMLNLLGDLWFAGGSAQVGEGVEPSTPPWERALALPGVSLHLYGKGEPRPGRKMGHLTVTAAQPEQALQVARQAAAALGLASF